MLCKILNSIATPCNGDYRIGRNLKKIKWQKFIARKGYKPRNVISKKEAEKSGLSEAEQLAEIKLGQWVMYIKYKNIVWQYPEQQAEFRKLRQETPTYFQKNSKRARPLSEHILGKPSVLFAGGVHIHNK